MHKLARQIVERRNLVFLFVVLATIFTVFAVKWVKVETDMTTYLPKTSETRLGLDIMEDQFTTYGSADVMVANITPDEADALSDQLTELKGVQMLDYDDTTDHYNKDSVSALYSITFDYPEEDDQCLEALDRVKEYLADYDIYVSTSLGNTQQETIDAEVRVIMVYVAVIIVVVLIFTSQTYAEVPVLILTFVVGMILNMGTNFLLGTISFVSNSVTNILQLALSLDYAIIFCNHFKEEHQTMPLKEAVIESLSKSIPEISSSSLTTIGGLVAMLFMQFKIGADMATCLIKAILFSMISVFVVMPGLLMLFGPYMDKTKHKNFVPDIPFVGRFAWRTRKIVPAIFVVVILIAYHFSSLCPYAYGYGLISAPKQNETQFAQQMIEDNFTSKNMLALIVPTGDYDKESAILDELGQYDEVDSTMGLTNIEALDGYMLADKLTPRQFAELAGLDYEAAQVVYAAYAAQHSEYGKLAGNLATYKVPLIDMFLFVCEQVDAGIVTLSDEQTQILQDAEVQMNSAKAQLQGTDYDRMLIYLTLPESSDETYAFTDKILEIAEKYYPDENVYLAGESTNEYEFEKSFAVDNKVVSIVSVLVVMLVLLFTFNSAGMPVLLILVIQGCIWLNFSFPTITGKYIFFLGYLIVSSIQMGANIDYAIVIASRYQELKSKMHHRDAIVETLNFAFPTIITSGSILSICGFLIGSMTSEPVIAGIGESLGRGTVISIIMVMFALPQILLIGSGIVDKTSFSVPSITEKKSGHGKVSVNGMVRGNINGTVHGIMHATVEGDIDLNLISGSANEEQDDEED
jgi:predicted RND superfamily exporter protein